MHVVTTDATIPGQSFGQNPPGYFSKALYADNNVTFDFAQFFYIIGFGEFYVWPDMPPNSSGAFLVKSWRVRNDFTSNRANVPGLSGESKGSQFLVVAWAAAVAQPVRILPRASTVCGLACQNPPRSCCSELA